MCSCDCWEANIFKNKNQSDVEINQSVCVAYFLFVLLEVIY